MHYRLVDVGPSDSPGEVFRADVRVLWWRPGEIPSDWQSCATLFQMNYSQNILKDEVADRGVYELVLNRLLFRHPSDVQK